MQKVRSSEKGQVIIPILGLFVVLVLALTISVDFGRFMLLRSRVRTIADTAALAGAGSLDIQRSAQGSFVLNETWAKTRVAQVVQETVSRNAKDSWMTISLSSASIQGRQVIVTVNGSCSSIWGGVIGIGSFSTSVTSSARAAVGITKEH